jgi:hypothetical protein
LKIIDEVATLCPSIAIASLEKRTEAASFMVTSNATDAVDLRPSMIQNSAGTIQKYPAKNKFSAQNSDMIGDATWALNGKFLNREKSDFWYCITLAINSREVDLGGRSSSILLKCKIYLLRSTSGGLGTVVKYAIKLAFSSD